MIEWLKKNIQGDKYIWLIAIILSVIGLLAVYSATSLLAFQQKDGNTEFFLIKHFLLIAFSFVAMWFAHKIDYKYYSKIALIGLYVSVPLLILTYTFGVNTNEASRWISIPVINMAFQPSDLAKLSLIVYLSSFLAKKVINFQIIESIL